MQPFLDALRLSIGRPLKNPDAPLTPRFALALVAMLALLDVGMERLLFIAVQQEEKTSLPADFRYLQQPALPRTQTPRGGSNALRALLEEAAFGIVLQALHRVAPGVRLEDTIFRERAHVADRIFDGHQIGVRRGRGVQPLGEFGVAEEAVEAVVHAGEASQAGRGGSPWHSLTT